MSSDVPASPFLSYLVCDLPTGYAFEVPLQPSSQIPLKEQQRRLLINQQVAFFDTAGAYATTHPWIGYLAALKHEALLEIIKFEATPFVGILDQKFFNDSQLAWKNLLKTSYAAMEMAVANNCTRLILLQRESLKIADSEKKFQAAVAAGFTALEPAPPKPPEPEENFSTQLIAALGINKARIAEAKAKVKAWHHHETYLLLGYAALKAVTSLPPEIRTSGLKDLSVCITALQNLRAEREMLTAAYVTPFVV